MVGRRDGLSWPKMRPEHRLLRLGIIINLLRYLGTLRSINLQGSEYPADYLTGLKRQFSVVCSIFTLKVVIAYASAVRHAACSDRFLPPRTKEVHTRAQHSTFNSGPLPEKLSTCQVLSLLLLSFNARSACWLTLPPPINLGSLHDSTIHSRTQGARRSVPLGIREDYLTLPP